MSKRTINVIRWPNGFINMIRVINEVDGAALEQEVEFQIEDMCKHNNIPRDEIQYRVFNIANVEIKDKL